MDADTSGGDTSVTERALISNASWSRTPAADDPLASHRPGTVECPGDASKREQLQGDATLAVDTARCNYYSGEQSLLAPVEAGDEIEARLWHFDLSASDRAEAHAAILIDGDVVWETRKTIPKDGTVDQELMTPSWEAQSAREAGATVTFHLHNHGSNQWNFIELTNLDPQ